MAEIELRDWLLFALVLIGTWIAWQQQKTARDQLRFQLFEKRAAVFQALMDFVKTITLNKRMDDEDFYRFLAGAQAREFLFDTDVTAYLSDIKEKAKRLDFLQLHRGDIDLSPSRREELSREARELVVWFGDELRDGHPTEKFTPYLHFGKRYVG